MIFCIASQKGGNSKTTTSLALWAGLNSRGKKALLVDLDPQGNATYAAGGNSNGATSREILTKEATAQETIQQTPTGALIPASKGLAGADLYLNETGKEYRLREALEPVKGEYDAIILDTPPALGILTVNAMTAAERLVITAQADAFSLQGIEELARILGPIRKYTNPGLEISGILLTRYSARSILTREVTDLADLLAQHLGTRVFDVKIREGIAVKESQLKRENLFSYAPRSNPAQDYQQFITELEGSI